jgi:two-component system, chemotaxis family, CheB/CheR fusion protein
MRLFRMVNTIKNLDKVDSNSSKFLYVGVGASAGGLDALRKFISNIPENNGMAFIIVQHMDPTHKSGLVNILSRYTTMEVLEVEDGQQVLPDHVYIIPPNKDMGILDGKLQLMEPLKPHGLRLPINYFFTNLAQDQKDKSVGIILSGFGSDGSDGLNAIKANGGICIAQDPSTAGSDAMPMNAINTGHVDMVLAPEEIPEKLISYKRSSTKILKKILNPEDKTIQALRKIFLLIRNRTGQDFSQYKKSTINRRIGRRMNIHQIEEMPQYLKYLQENPEEIDQLFQEFLIGVTNFFRDPEAFESLKQGALKDMIKEKDNADILRIWVPGCSSGEEVYSIAIIVKELLEETGKNLEVQIFGTDLDSNSIKTARSGTYSNIIEDIGPERLHKFFYKKDNLYTIKNDIRDMVIFANHNIITDPPFTKLDLISCRNLLIYLESEAQERVLSNLNYALKKDGILFIGPSENIGDFLDAFSVIDNKWKIFKCVKSSRLLFDNIKPRTIPYQQPNTYWKNQYALKDLKAGQSDFNITKIAEKNLIDIYAPPSALINKLGDILFIHGRLGKYIEPSPGKAHMNILEMAKDGIKLGLSTAIQNALSNNKEVVVDSLQVDAKDNNKYIKLTVKPINDRYSVKGLLIVSFEESYAQNLAQNKIKLHIDSNNNEHIKALENELKLTKERLKANVEEMTTSNEELKSANEELQSLNEESQSTNEELETSKEELQSTNEELSTVNSELQIKIDELSRINDDMINLFNSSQIAIIFVDNDLKIRSFTKESTKLIKLIESDVGRPLSDITMSIKYPDLIDDITKVIEKLEYKEKEVRTNDNVWYKVRIMPYKTSQNVIDGVTITFSNITNLKNTQEKIQSALDYAENIVNTVHEPLVVLDDNLKIKSANRSFYETFDLLRSETEGEKLYHIGGGKWNNKSLKSLLEDVLPKNKEINNYEYDYDFPKIGHGKMLLNARRIYRGDIGTQLILIAMQRYDNCKED